MKLSSALTVAVVGLLMTAVDAAQQVRGRSTREGRGGVRGQRQLMMDTGKSKPSTGGTGYWSGTPRPNPTEATITSITITSNNGGTTSVTNNNGSGRGSDPVEGTGATINGISVTPNNGGGSSTVITPGNSGSSSGGSAGGATISGITVTPNNGGSSTVVTNNGSGRGSDPVEGTGASITGISVTPNNGGPTNVIYQVANQVVRPSTGYTQTANTYSKKPNKSKGRRAGRRIYKPQRLPDLSEAHVGAITVNGKPVDTP